MHTYNLEELEIQIGKRPKPTFFIIDAYITYKDFSKGHWISANKDLYSNFKKQI